LTNDAVHHEPNSRTKLLWWILTVTILTVCATVCVNTFLIPVEEKIDLAGLAAIVLLPFTAEAFIQFTTWWRRLLWIFAGILTIALAVYFFFTQPSDVQEMSERIRGPVFFLLPSILEFMAASGTRKHAWIWVATTPLLLGFLNDWGLAVLEGIDVVLLFFESHGVVLTRQLPEFYAVAAIFGAIFFTRALIGSLIASRIPPR
jgi:hypothetical protein